MTLAGTHTYEGYTNGAAAQVGDDGIGGVTGTVQYATAAAFRGSLGIRFLTTGGAASVYYDVTALSADGKSGTYSAYFSIHTVGSGGGLLLNLRNGGGNHLARFQMTTTGGNHFYISDGAGALQGSAGAVAFVADDLFRVDFHWNWNSTSNLITCSSELYKGTNINGYVPDEVLAPPAFACTLIPTRMYIGQQAASYDVYMDDVRPYTKSTDLPDPITASPAATSDPVRTISSSGLTWVTLNPGAISDTSDATYAEFASGGGSGRWFMSPSIVLASGQFTLRMGLDSGTSAKTVVVKLYQDNVTLAKQWTGVSVTTTPSDYNFVLDAGALAAITDATQLYVDVVWA
jgi:hypothetical protein